MALLVIFCAVWFGFYLAKTITIPIMDLAAGTRRVAEGDLTVSIDSNAADDEIGSLVDAFNKMTTGSALRPPAAGIVRPANSPNRTRKSRHGDNTWRSY